MAWEVKLYYFKISFKWASADLSFEEKKSFPNAFTLFQKESNTNHPRNKPQPSIHVYLLEKLLRRERAIGEVKGRNFCLIIRRERMEMNLD